MVNLGADDSRADGDRLGDTTGFLFFALGAIVLLPGAGAHGDFHLRLARAADRACGSNLPALWRNSPVAVVSVFLVGMSNASFGTLAAVYADRDGSGADLLRAVRKPAGAGGARSARCPSGC
jgi:hypothetical protein